MGDRRTRLSLWRRAIYTPLIHEMISMACHRKELKTLLSCTDSACCCEPPAPPARLHAAGTDCDSDSRQLAHNLCSHTSRTPAGPIHLAPSATPNAPLHHARLEEIPNQRNHQTRGSSSLKPAVAISTHAHAPCVHAPFSRSGCSTTATSKQSPQECLRLHMPDSSRCCQARNRKTSSPPASPVLLITNLPHPLALNPLLCLFEPLVSH